MTGAGGVRLGRSSIDERDRRLAAARRAELTYDHVGSTLHPERFPGRAPRKVRRNLTGLGDHTFITAADGLRAWVPQRHLGAGIHPPLAAVAVGETLLVILALGPVEVTAPNRVVWVLDELDRFGFAYGTLPGHPASGEEAFMVERVDHGRLDLSVTVDATPATPAGRALAPLVAQVQRQAVNRYLQGLAMHIQG